MTIAIKNSRRFLGNLETDPNKVAQELGLDQKDPLFRIKLRKEINFRKAHLKAYLKGKVFFNHGFIDTPSGRQPEKYKVLQQTLIPTKVKAKK